LNKASALQSIAMVTVRGFPRIAIHCDLHKSPARLLDVSLVFALEGRRMVAQGESASHGEKDASCSAPEGRRNGGDSVPSLLRSSDGGDDRFPRPRRLGRGYHPPPFQGEHKRDDLFTELRFKSATCRR